MSQAESQSAGTLVPVELYRKATDVASLCKEIVVKTAVNIQDRNYVKVEGWQAIATAHGCSAGARNVEKVEGGYRCIGEVRRIDTGVVIAEAEGFVGEDEATWFGGVIQTRNGQKTLPKRNDYAIRAMCQTRAISRVCRSAFAHVVVLMDAGLSTTPAEEVPAEGFTDRVSPEPKQALLTVVKDAKGHYRLPQGTRWQDVEVHFGKNKGIPLSRLKEETIGWYRDKWEPKPYGQATEISDADKLLLAAVNEWALEKNPDLEAAPR